MQAVMAREDRIVLLSGERLRPNCPTLLLLHGATDDPSEMLTIAGQWAESKNVFLYSYNYHEPVEKLASDLLREMMKLRSTTEALTGSGSAGGNFTVIAYSYAAIVFRKSVLLAPDKALFSSVSLIQLVPTAGGSRRARTLWNPVLAFLVSMASMPSTAQNPYGTIARELWDENGTRLFDAAISPNRVHTLLVEADSNSLAHVRNKEVRERYQNGIGSNVVVIPKRFGVTHSNFPNHPVALDYLRQTIESTASGHLNQAVSRADGLGGNDGRLN